MKVYRIKDKCGNFIHTVEKRSMWMRLMWLNYPWTHNLDDCTIVEYELVPTGKEQTVFSWKEGTVK